jgi:5-methylcytosine-specific restriction endonuclease McrA
MADNRPSGNLRSAVRVYLWTLAGGRCVICGCATRLDASSSSADCAQVGHLLADSEGGRWNLTNLTNQCRACNEGASKAGYLNLLPLVPLFAVPAGIPTVDLPLSSLPRTAADVESIVRADARKALGMPF